MDDRAEGYRRNAAEVRRALWCYRFSIRAGRVVDGIVQGSLDLGRGRAVFETQDELAELVGLHRSHVTTELEGLIRLRVVECRDCLYMVLLPVERWNVSRRVPDGEVLRALQQRVAARDPEVAYESLRTGNVKGLVPVASRDLFGAEDELNEELRALSGNESRLAGRDNGSLTSEAGPAGGPGAGLVRSGQAFAAREAGTDSVPLPAGHGAAGYRIGTSSPLLRTDSVLRGEGREGRLSVSVSGEAFKRSTLNVAAAAGTETVRSAAAGPRSRGMALPEDELMRLCMDLFGEREMKGSGGHWRKVAKLMGEALTEGLATLRTRTLEGHRFTNPPAWLVSWLHRNYREDYDKVRVS